MGMSLGGDNLGADVLSSALTALWWTRQLLLPPQSGLKPKGKAGLLHTVNQNRGLQPQLQTGREIPLAPFSRRMSSQKHTHGLRILIYNAFW